MTVDTITQASEMLTAIINLIPQIITLATSVIGLFAGLAALIKKPETQGLWADIHQLINWLGCNVGHARNQE